MPIILLKLICITIKVFMGLGSKLKSILISVAKTQTLSEENS